MLKALKIWYYKRLFIKIYFRYLNGSDPQNAVNDALEDIKAINKIEVMMREVLNAH
jgi:hypothetical protein|nr:MAG TPA: hypothetical protein [Caudoviricetes sp.]